jgi:hypothetical protein
VNVALLFFFIVVFVVAFYSILCCLLTSLQMVHADAHDNVLQWSLGLLGACAQRSCALVSSFLLCHPVISLCLHPRDCTDPQAITQRYHTKKACAVLWQQGSHTRRRRFASQRAACSSRWRGGCTVSGWVWGFSCAWSGCALFV